MAEQSINSHPGSFSRRKLFLFVFIVMDIALAAVLVSIFQQRNEHQFTQELRQLGATIYPQASALPAFTLSDQFGQTFTQDRLLDKWTLVFFGFTSCPDICPLTMNELAQFVDALQNTPFAADTAVVLITVDPERDSDAAMADYMASFNSDFIGLNGQAQQIARLADELYVTYADSRASGQTQTGHQSHIPANVEHELMDQQDYLINHSGHIALINPAGRYHAVLRAPHRDQDLLRAYTLIRTP